MDFFAIDIERLYLEYHNTSKELKGLFCLQYPIYCIHSTIEDATIDPLDSFDQLIIDVLSSDSSLDPYQVASLIGTSKKLIQLRLSVLSNDRLIKISGQKIILTELGKNVFRNRALHRIHIRSYDFLIDGITLNPLPEIYYTYYRSKLISEDECNFKTMNDGTTKTIKPFSPDIVHTPPNKDIIIEKLLFVPTDERIFFSVPKGLKEIKEVSFSRLTFPVLIAASHSEGKVFKEPIDGFYSYSVNDKTTFLESIRGRILPIIMNLDHRMLNLTFKLYPKPSGENPKDFTPRFTTNWSEIDRYSDNHNIIFSISTEDLLCALKSVYDISFINESEVINTNLTIGLTVTKETLLYCGKKQKLVADLVRGRNYMVLNIKENVFLVFFSITSDDPFVQEVLRCKQFYKEISDNIKISTALKKFVLTCGYSMRELLISSGEFDILERLDIEDFMTDLSNS